MIFLKRNTLIDTPNIDIKKNVRIWWTISAIYMSLDELKKNHRQQNARMARDARRPLAAIFAALGERMAGNLDGGRAGGWRPRPKTVTVSISKRKRDGDGEECGARGFFVSGGPPRSGLWPQNRLHSRREHACQPVGPARVHFQRVCVSVSCALWPNSDCGDAFDSTHSLSISIVAVVQKVMSVIIFFLSKLFIRLRWNSCSIKPYIFAPYMIFFLLNFLSTFAPSQYCQFFICGNAQSIDISGSIFYLYRITINLKKVSKHVCWYSILYLIVLYMNENYKN